MADNRPTLLIIEYNEPYARFIKNCIEPANNFRIFITRTLDDALPFILHHKPLVIVYDVFLASGSNEAFFHRIRQSEKGHYFYTISLAALKNTEYISQAYRSGADFFLGKNFSRLEITSVLNNIIRYDSDRRQLMNQEKHYRTLFELAADAMLLTDQNNFTILAANNAACRLFGMAERELMRSPLIDLCAEKDLLSGYLKERFTLITGLIFKNKEGSNIPVSIDISYHTGRNNEQALFSVKDLRKMLTAQLPMSESRKSTKKRSKITKEHEAFLLGETNERRRISREIHDHIGQLLVSVKLQLENLASETKSTSVGQKLIQARDQLIQAIKSMRQIIAGMDTELLPKNNLKYSITELTNQLKTKHGLDIELDISILPKNMTIAVQMNIYRIIEEALSNVLKHSKGEKTVINCSLINEKQYELTIISLGLQEQSGRISPGTGIKIMQQRASMIGATLNVAAGANKTFIVKLVLPFSGEKLYS